MAMFMTCMNYWFYYMSSWIIMVGLWWQYRGRPRIRDVAMISAPPIAAAAFTAIMVMALSGGVEQASTGWPISSSHARSTPAFPEGPGIRTRSSCSVRLGQLSGNRDNQAAMGVFL